MSEWTKGPWLADSKESAPWRVLACDERATIVCDVTGASGNPTARADAQLIAAAPEMAELLERLDIGYDIDEPDCFQDSERVVLRTTAGNARAIRALLSRIHGGEPS